MSLGAEQCALTHALDVQILSYPPPHEAKEYTTAGWRDPPTQMEDYTKAAHANDDFITPNNTVYSLVTGGG